ncbi:MAG: class I SAM-dependent methyltransferase [Eubacteriales bacterium]|nr:class I SAM-dependent methyltransferase [Eubacteriales bacterium]
MASYNIFAEFYDDLTQNVEYEKIAKYVSSFFKKYYPSGKTVLDLACGTGTLSKLLNEEGYNIIGIDLSDDMLCIASSKSVDNASFIKGDISSFALPQKVDYCVCSLDSINHLKSIEQVGECFNCVYNSLVDGGIFVFDVNTVYKHKNVLKDNTFVFDEENFFLSWDNEYLGENTVRILLDFFVFNGVNYDRFSEEFCEKAYEISELENKLNKFKILGVYDELTLTEPKNDSERIYFVCKKVNN